jgi:hypothetical protein
VRKQAKNVLISLCVSCSIAVAGTSFEVDTLYQFTPLSGSMPGPAAANSYVDLQISGTSGSYPSSIDIQSYGAPQPGEQNVLANAGNSAQYNVTSVVNLPSSVSYGFAADGTIFDPANTILGGRMRSARRASSPVTY